MNNLRTPTYAETISIESYKTSAGTALSDANSFADKIVTAAVSIASAYGAVIALVAPKGDPSPIAVAGPFVALAVAVAAALYAQSIGVNLDPTNDLDTIRSRIVSSVSSKRIWAGAGLFLLAVGMVWAGIVVHDTYGKPAKDESKAATLFLTSDGAKLVRTACGSSVTQIDGKVGSASALADKRVALKVSAKDCPGGAGTLSLPQTAITVARLNG
jgi:hypothetical protein